MDDRFDLMADCELDDVNGGMICGAICMVAILKAATVGEPSDGGASVDEAGSGVSGGAG